MSKVKDSLVDKIHDALVENGYERTPGTNEFRAPAQPGHNSGDKQEESESEPEGDGGFTVAADQLRLFIERVERLESEKQGIADDVKDVYAEAKSSGYCSKTMRKIVALRKLEKHVRDEADALLETYRNALGMA